MFNLFKKKSYVPEDVRLKKIIEILFPPLAVHVMPDGTKYHIDYSADSNLDAALSDLEDGSNDAVTQKTIRGISNRLVEVRKILEAYREMDKEAKYVIVDDFEDNTEIKADDRPH
jgi:hypothetical protein